MPVNRARDRHDANSAFPGVTPGHTKVYRYSRARAAVPKKVNHMPVTRKKAATQAARQKAALEKRRQAIAAKLPKVIQAVNTKYAKKFAVVERQRIAEQHRRADALRRQFTTGRVAKRKPRSGSTIRVNGEEHIVF